MSGDFLSQDEADALIAKVLGNDEASGEIAVESTDGIAPYEMGRQERIVRGRMPTLEIINERFARFLRVGLFSYMRKNPEITVGPVKVHKYADFIRHLPIPANFNIVNIKPFRGQSLFIFDPTLVDTVVETMFGGKNQYKSKAEGRAFTALELRLIDAILAVAFEEYSKSWQPVHSITPEFVRQEEHTQFASIANPSEIVVSTAFSIEIGSSGGMFHICFPYSMIEPIRDLLYSSMHGDQTEPDTRWAKSLRAQIETTKVELVADLAEVELSLADIAMMQIGDIIPLDIPEFIEGRIEGIPVMNCKYGIKGGKYSLLVNEIFQDKIEQSLVTTK